MSMVPPTGKKQNFWQGLSSLLQNPQFMGGLQQLGVGLTKHPDPGFHARQSLLINRATREEQDRQFGQREYLEEKQAAARKAAFLNQMVTPPPQVPGSGVDPTYRPPGMAPAPTQGMNSGQQQHIQRLMQAGLHNEALNLMTSQQFPPAPKPLQPTGKMQEMEAIHGKGTPEYRAGLARTYEPEAAKPSERDNKVSDYMRTYGMSRGDAIKVVDGKKKLVSDSEYGGYHMVDMVTGKSEYRSSQGRQSQTSSGQTAKMPATKAQRTAASEELKGVQEALRLLKDPSTAEAIKGGVGLIPRSKQITGGIVGQAQDVAEEIPIVGDMLPEERVFEGTKAKRSQLSLVDRGVKQALLLNKRAPVQEQLDLAEKYSFLNMGLDETQAEEVRQTLIKNLEERAAKAYGILGNEPSPGDSDFNKMPRDELLNYDVDRLTPEQFEAFSRALSRYE